MYIRRQLIIRHIKNLKVCLYHEKDCKPRLVDLFCIIVIDKLLNSYHLCFSKDRHLKILIILLLEIIKRGSFNGMVH